MTELSSRPGYRIERDSFGPIELPDQVYYGAQTYRATQNFQISGLKPHPLFIWSLAVIKRGAAQANRELGMIPAEIADAIMQAAEEVMNGKLHDQFVVDPYQAGAGTSHHMNMNEVLANRALEILGYPKGDDKKISPNNHVNFGQSTNDVIPTAIRIGGLRGAKELLPAIELLENELYQKAKEFDHIVKSGRTHLQDAVPIRLGQEFGGMARSIQKCRYRIDHAMTALYEIGLGGSAAGTGLNTHPDYRKLVAKHLAELTGFPLVPAADFFEAMSSLGPAVEISGACRELAIELGRIANDLRLLSSGPTTGIAEIRLPELQPGSSIMPGKVNPVIPEMVNMVCYQVMGMDTTVALASGAGQFQLNVMMPVIAHNLFWELTILRTACEHLAVKCVRGITADEAKCREYLLKNAQIATALNPVIGYLNAAEVVKEWGKTGRSIRDIVIEKGFLTAEEVDKILSPEAIRAMTEPGVAKK
ncbi:MAG: aspartate ammonia-lyase [bacterium]|nr:aspartate ammonia-lyase [bacterium]